MNDWFWARAMATEGDLSVGQNKLNDVASLITNNYLQLGIPPSYAAAVECCMSYGFNYDTLLEEEKDYLDKKVEELIKLDGTKIIN